MSNVLTGDFDAIVEISVAAVNKILASVHQKGTGEDIHPKFLHSVTARVGDVPEDPLFEVPEAILEGYFGAYNVDSGNVPQDAIRIVQEGVHSAQEAVRKIGTDLSKIAPSTAGAEMVADLGNFAQTFVVRGTAKIQVGTPTLTVPHGSTSEVTVHAQIRALYTPDPGTLDLPKPIHGEVQAAFTAEYNASGSTGKPALDVKPSDDDSKFTFIPAPGTYLTAQEAKQIARQVRRFLRTKFEPMTAELPDEFPFKHFKSLVDGSTQAIALPLLITGDIPALTNPLDSVTNHFLGSGDAFAIGISKDFINKMLQEPLQEVKNFHYGPVPIKPFLVTLGYAEAWVSDVTVGWEPGAISLTITGVARIWGELVFDNQYNVTITQTFTLTLSQNQTISLTPASQLDINGLPQIIKSRAKDEITRAVNPAVDSAQGMIQEELSKPRATFNDAVKRFDANANARYTAIEITPDGVILRGSLDLSSRPPVVVDFSQTAGGTALTAFKSWVPAGTVDKYVWHWVTRGLGQVLPWDGAVQEESSRHSFIFSKFGGSGFHQWARRLDLDRVCLRVDGTQVGVGSVSEHGVTTCKVGAPPSSWEATMPAAWVNLMLPIWGPDPGPEGVLSSAIVAHVAARSEAGQRAGTGTTTIVHFANDRSVAPLPMLSEALLATKSQEAEVVTVLVLPQGSFEQTRAAVESRLGALAGQLRGSLVVTEDYGGSWTKAFKAPRRSATYLMNAKGELSWQQVGRLKAQALTAALDAHVSTPALDARESARSLDDRTTAPLRRRSSLLRSALRTGEPAPDVSSRDAPDESSLLHRLRGQRVLLIFWKSWSAPCLAELKRLQLVQDSANGKGPVIVAVGDGEDLRRVRKIARQHRLRFTMVPDADRRIASQFGISCWPTTMWINEDGRVHGSHFGTTPERSSVTLR